MHVYYINLSFEDKTMISVKDLEKKTLVALRKIAKDLDVQNASKT